MTLLTFIFGPIILILILIIIFLILIFYILIVGFPIACLIWLIFSEDHSWKSFKEFFKHDDTF